ncbi:MAG: beta-lactamase [Gemmatimonadetes bacterium]|nr:beta-lactamase [Gemmatimonadota bacterium]
MPCPVLSRRTRVAMAVALGLASSRGAHAQAATARPLRRPPATRAAIARALHDTLQGILDRARADSAFPGAWLVVGTRQGVLTELGTGTIDWKRSPRPTSRTVWDIASLTKVVATTSAIMQLVEQQKLDLDAPAQRYLPEWTGAGKERVTVRDLILHRSGLPPFKALPYDLDADSTRRALLAVPLDTAPGARMAYSDIGFIVLAEIVRHVSGERIDAYARRHVFRPLGMTDTRYNPPRAWMARIAPTETDTLRGGQVRGVVHDERAWRMDGVAGHAGVFSSGRDLARFCLMYMNGGVLDGVRVFSAATVSAFTAYQDSTWSNRALGWQKPELPGMKFTGPSAAWGGHGASALAIGHTGFTGTSLYMDPAHDVFVVLLTNRVNPTRNHSRITPVRNQVADAVLAVLAHFDSTPGSPRQ